MKKLIFFTISIVMLILLFCCNNNNRKKDKTPIEIGVVLPGSDESYVNVGKSMEKYAKVASKKICIEYTDDISNDEKRIIENFVDRGAKVLILWVNNTKKTSEILKNCKKIKDKNIRIVSCENIIPDTPLISAVVSYGGISIGKEQGSYLVYNTSKEKDNPLYLYANDAENNEDIALFEGAWKTLWPKIDDGTFVIMNSNEAKKLKKKSVLTNSELKKIMREVSVTETSIKSTLSEKNIKDTHLKDGSKKCKYILAPDDRSARSIIDCMGDHSKNFKYYITGHGLEEESIDYIKNSKQSMSIYENKTEIAKDAVDVANMLYINFDIGYDELVFNGVKDVKIKHSKPTIAMKSNIASILSLK